MCGAVHDDLPVTPRQEDLRMVSGPRPVSVIRMDISTASPTKRRLPELVRKAGLAVAMLVVCEIGAHIVAPGLNGQALREFLHQGSGTWLLRAYDWLVGGALSRGAVLGIGIMPYISARIIMRLARGASHVDVPRPSAE
jgi:preprotein translocase subunit SecY